MNKLFVLASQGRSGTHMLRTTLNSHSRISLAHELFNTDIFEEQKNKGDPFEAPWEGGPVRDFLFDLQSVHGPRKLTGVCVQPRQFQLRPNGYNELIEMQLPSIVLYRRNIFRQYISTCQAKARGQWQAYLGDTVRTIQPLTICMEDFWGFMRIQREDLANMLNDFPGACVVSYEQLTGNFEPTIRRVLEYLGVEPTEHLKPSTLQVGFKNLADSIGNLDEVTNALTMSGHENFLD